MSSTNNTMNKTLTFVSLSSELGAFKKNVDTFFLVIMGSIVFFLQAGFAFNESGMARAKNVTSVLFRNYMSSSIGCFFYFIFGYAFAFGEGSSFCGQEYFGLVGLPNDKMAHCFFQYTFAMTAVTIVSATVHERCTMTAYFSYTILISGFVYPIVSHWAWHSSGWLNALGYQDFAGGAVVHACGGAAGLAAAWMAGPRLGRFEKNGDIQSVPPHSVPQAALGGFIFFFGIIAFNSGANLSISNTNDGVIVSRTVISTLISVAAATTTALLYQRFVTSSGRLRKNWSFMNALNGSYVGMIVVAAGCDQYAPWAALVVGILSYGVYLVFVKILIKMRIDDASNGIPIHLGCGFFGVIGAAIFGNRGVILSPSKASSTMLLMNLVGGLVIIIWSFTITLLLYVVLRFFDLHRVSAADEKLGLDLAVHNQAAYNNDDPLEAVDSAETIGHNNTKMAISATSLRGIRRMVSVPHLNAWKAENYIQ